MDFLHLIIINILADGESGYTFFIPRDDAFWRVLVQDATAPDPFVKDPDFRLETLLSHLVKGRLFIDDLENERQIQTVANKTFVVRRNGDNVTLSDGRQTIKILGDQRFVYNLGTIFFIDRVLFTETSDVIRVMENFQDDVVMDDDDNDDDAEFEFGNDEDEFGSDYEQNEEDDVFEFQDDDTDEGEFESEDENEDEVEDEVEDEDEDEDELPRGTRRNDQDPESEFAEIEFSQEDDLRDDDVEEKVIFVNNQKVSILKQKKTDLRH